MTPAERPESTDHRLAGAEPVQQPQLDTLYEVDIQTWVSPDELASFCALLEDEGYHVVTDLANGKLRVDERGDDR